MSTYRRVVAGVDGSEAGLQAVRYAAAAAAETGCTLEIVHVAPAYQMLPPVRPVEPPFAYEDVYRAVLGEAKAAALEVAPDVRYRTSVRRGPTVPQLARASRGAELVVLGAKRGGLRHVWTGRIKTGVAVRAACPTVAVPPEWQPGTSHGRVVVGVKEPERARPLLAEGFAEADRRGAELVVVHGWKLPSAYDDIVADRVGAQQMRAGAESWIEDQLVELRQEHPEVNVTIEVVHASGADAIVEASRDADLVLMVRTAGRHALPHLGSTARAVLRAAACPVMVRPVGEEPTLPLSSLEREGALLR